MTITYAYDTEQISIRLHEYGLPADVVYAIVTSVSQQRHTFMEALRIARCVEAHGVGIADCAQHNAVFSTEDLCVATDDLARLAGQSQVSRNAVEHLLTLAQHLIGTDGHKFRMEMSAMIWA